VRVARVSAGTGLVELAPTPLSESAADAVFGLVPFLDGVLVLHGGIGESPSLVLRYVSGTGTVSSPIAPNGLEGLTFSDALASPKGNAMLASFVRKGSPDRVEVARASCIGQ
jgi:hypothetical protein